MKKLSLMLVVGLFFLVYACGGGGGDTPKAVMTDLFNVMDSFYSSMDKADNADAIVAAIEKFSKGMQEIAPRMKKVQEKYPDLKNIKDPSQLPPELKEFEGKFKELGTKMMGMMGKLMKYANDPKVQAAQQKMMEAMNALQ